jgi:hypothetical protein
LKGAQFRLQLIFNVTSTSGRSSSLQSGNRHFKPGSQVADFQCAVLSTVSFNTQTDGSADLKGGEALTIKSKLFEPIGLLGAIFSRRAARLPATRLIRSNGE